MKKKRNIETTRKPLSTFKENTRGSLKNIIKYLYGKSILAEVNTFSKLRTFLAKNLSNLAFLKNAVETITSFQNSDLKTT